MATLLTTIGRAADGAGERTAVPALRVDVFARSWGDVSATPLVLVAGLGASSRYWVRLGRRLAAAGHGVVASDLPGFGRTAAVPGGPVGPDVRELADQLVAWMDARQIGRAVLVGHSVGCQAVVDVAARFPGRVDRVVLMAPPFEPGRRSLAVCLPRLAAGAAFEAVSLPPLLAREYGSTGPARAIVQAVRSMDYPMEQMLPRVAAATLVVHGQFDPLVSRRWAGTVARLLRRPSLVVVGRVGHAMHYSAAAVTAGVVDRFVRGDLDGRSPAGVLVPRDDPRRDPQGPPQPISLGLLAAVDVVAAALAVAVPPPRARRLLGTVAAVTLAGDALAAAGRLPMVTRGAAGAACGLGLLVAAVRSRDRPSARWATAAFGLYHLAAAALVAKPTGPARLYRVN